jgi:hypothetical protein
MTPAQEKPEQLGWQRMGSYVHQLLRRHPDLQALRDAEEPVLLSCHSRGVWAHALNRGHGAYELEERIEAEEWWLPLKRSHGRELADRLARELRRQWERRDVAGTDQSTTHGSEAESVEGKM